MDKPLKSPPSYAIASVDHALRLAAMLQLEGSLTVAEAAARLGVARSTAHRLLQMLVYRDFAAQDQARSYHAGPVLQLAEHSGSQTARLRAAALPHLSRLVDLLDESANLTIRTGATARFIASVECGQALRVGSREGMVFPAHWTTGGMLLLAELDDAELAQLYPGEPDQPSGPAEIDRQPAQSDRQPGGQPGGHYRGQAVDAAEAAEAVERPDLRKLRAELARIRRAGFAVNQGRSERGVTAVGVPVRDAAGRAVAGLSVSIPSARYDKEQLPLLVAALHKAAGGIEADLSRG